MNFSNLVLHSIKIDLLSQNVLIVIFLGVFFIVFLYLNVRNFIIKGLMLNDIKGINRDVWLDVKIRYYNLLFI